MLLPMLEECGAPLEGCAAVSAEGEPLKDCVVADAERVCGRWSR